MPAPQRLCNAQRSPAPGFIHLPLVGGAPSCSFHRARLSASGGYIHSDGHGRGRSIYVSCGTGPGHARSRFDLFILSRVSGSGQVKWWAGVEGAQSLSPGAGGHGSRLCCNCVHNMRGTQGGNGPPHDEVMPEGRSRAAAPLGRGSRQVNQDGCRVKLGSSNGSPRGMLSASKKGMVCPLSGPSKVMMSKGAAVGKYWRSP